MITMFHWDLPQYIQDLGGLTSDAFVEYFKAYADVLFASFGDKVKTWITMNEPFNFCTAGYGKNPDWAPAIESPGVGEYLCGHNLLLAHAAAYHLYKEKYFEKQQGSIGITLDSRFYYPKDKTVTNEDLQRAQLYRLGWFAHPLFSKTGGYPQVMVDEIGKRCKQEGRSFSRLPILSTELKEHLRGTSDFFGLNYYTSRLLSIDRSEYALNESSPAWFKDSKGIIDVEQSWKRGKSEWLFSVPQGLRHLLKWIKDEYDNPRVFITENGWSDDGELEDVGRIDYFKQHLTAVAQAINEDKCNVIGWTAWSLLDSFEWDRGYLEKFGLFSVNMTSSQKERAPKQSAWFLRDFIKSRKINS
jgi:beta-glucosidase/6-phospho-beta-glucosidase/beta-galactosidase